MQVHRKLPDGLAAIPERENAAGPRQPADLAGGQPGPPIRRDMAETDQPGTRGDRLLHPAQKKVFIRVDFDHFDDRPFTVRQTLGGLKGYRMFLIGYENLVSRLPPQPAEYHTVTFAGAHRQRDFPCIGSEEGGDFGRQFGLGLSHCGVPVARTDAAAAQLLIALGDRLVHTDRRQTDSSGVKVNAVLQARYLAANPRDIHGLSFLPDYRIKLAAISDRRQSVLDRDVIHHDPERGHPALELRLTHQCPHQGIVASFASKSYQK